MFSVQSELGVPSNASILPAAIWALLHCAFSIIYRSIWPMRTPAALAIAAFCSVTFFAQIGSAQEKRPVDRERRDCAGWVAKCLADFKAIRVGMTRSEIEARFPQD